jgi:hypothetical protein
MRFKKIRKEWFKARIAAVETLMIYQVTLHLRAIPLTRMIKICRGSRKTRLTELCNQSQLQPNAITKTKMRIVPNAKTHQALFGF